MKKGLIAFSANGTIEGQARVVIQKFIAFSQDGKEKGYIDASFDFSNIPTELHGFGLGAIPKGYRIDLPSCNPKLPKPSIETKRWWRFWDRADS